MLFSLLIIITIYGLVKKSVVPLFIFWIIFLLALWLNFIGKLLVFRWELSMLLLLQICFFFVMREISWSLSHGKIRLTLLRFLFKFIFKIPWYLLNIDNIYFDCIHPTELHLNRANSSDTDAHFLFESMYIKWYTFHQIYDGRDNFDFDIVNFPFLDGDVPGVPHMGYTYLSFFKLSDFNCRNKALTTKLLRQGYRYFKLRKAFSKFYRRHSALVEKYSVSLKKNFCNKEYRNQNFTVSWCTDLDKLWENLSFRSISEN